MSNFRDFDAALREKAGDAPKFKVGGEEFRCRAKLPYRKLAKMMKVLENQGDPTSEDAIRMAEEFFKIVLVKKDVDRFIELLNDEGDDDDEDEEGEERVIAFDEVMELLEWLMDYYTGDTFKKQLDAQQQVSTSVPQDLSGLEIETVSLNPKV